MTSSSFIDWEAGRTAVEFGGVPFEFDVIKLEGLRTFWLIEDRMRLWRQVF